MKSLILTALLISSTGYAKISDLGQFITSWDLERAKNAFDGCGHNDGSKLGIYDVSTSTSKKRMNAIKKFDKKKGCYKRIYSSSKENAIKLFNELTKEGKYDSEVTSCVQGHVSELRRNKLDEILASEDTVSVYTSFMHKKEIHSEGCLYFDTYIYRKNGEVLKITFNYTD